MTSPAGNSSASYLDNGWQSGRSLPNGATTAYGYNALGMLSSLQNNSNFSTILSQYGSFAYDGVFNMTGLSASIPGATSQGGATTFTYDTKDRLTQEASARNGGYTGNFGYDTAGNPTTFKGASQSFNSDNQRSATGFVFDGNGNPTTYSGSTLTFDPENRLSSIGTSWTAGYRADGLRGWKQNGSTRTYFLYDGGEPVVELDSSGNVQAINVFAPDGLVARKQSGVWTQYVFDQQGNVAQRLDSSANPTSSSIYDAYGVESTTGTPTDPFGYNARWGYLLDRDTGLYLCRNRYYDSGVGRWLTRDPIGYHGGANVYGYTKAVGGIDTSGTSVQALALSAVDNPCDALRSEMRRVSNRAVGRMDESWNDERGMFDGLTDPKYGTYDKHLKAILQAQQQLSKLLKRYLNLGCDPDDPEAKRALHIISMQIWLLPPNSIRFGEPHETFIRAPYPWELPQNRGASSDEPMCPDGALPSGREQEELLKEAQEAGERDSELENAEAA